MFNWDLAFQNENKNEEIKILTKTLMNICNNFSPNKTARFDFKKPAWSNKDSI